MSWVRNEGILTETHVCNLDCRVWSVDVGAEHVVGLAIYDRSQFRFGSRPRHDHPSRLTRPDILAETDVLHTAQHALEECGHEEGIVLVMVRRQFTQRRVQIFQYETVGIRLHGRFKGGAVVSEVFFGLVLIDLVVKAPDVEALLDCSLVVCLPLSLKPYLPIRRGGFDDGPDRHASETGSLL